jgi:subtilisin family serine protease
VRLAPEYAASAEDALAKLGFTVVREILLVQQSLRAQDQALRRKKPMQLDEALAIEERLLRSYVVSYQHPSIPPERIIASLQLGCGPVECAAPWCVMELCGEPNDPEASKQGLLQLIRATSAWDVEDGSDSVVIGISDSGVRQDHEDLKDAIWVRATEVPGNGIDDDRNGYVDDYNGYSFSAEADGTGFSDTYNPNNGHGTSVAGTCGARVNNNVGIAGVANSCKLFPLRTMPNGTSGIVYGYESIMYCATNGVDVVNCSWGGQSRSCIDEDVVAYAVARGTAVVAAAGNHGSPSPFFPASYRGVLSVGVVDASDNVVPMSGHGPMVDIMAPGHGSWSTANDGTYAGFCCTSGSAPIASAVVALVRSRHPELGPREACAVVRATARPSPWAFIPASIDTALLPPGRIDALSAVTADPSQLVSLVLDSVLVTGPGSEPRWTIGDTIEVRLRLRNELAPVNVTMLDSIRLAGLGPRGLALVGAPSIPCIISAVRGEHFVTTPMKFVVRLATDTATFALLVVKGTNENGQPFRQTLSCSITPSPAYVTLANDRLRISVGDRGRIGNTDIQRGQGDGVTIGSFCGQMYEGGLIVSANGRVVDNVRTQRGVNDHFRSIKGFIHPSPELGIMRDVDAPDSLRIGVQVEQRVVLDSVRGLMLMDVTVTNVSDTTLHDLAVGWFCDWDLGRQPADNISYTKSAAQIVQSTSSSVFVAQSIFSSWTDARYTLHGMDNTTTYGGFSQVRKDALLRGNEAAFTGVNDIATIVGVRFTSPLPPGHIRNLQHVIAVDTSEANALQLVGSHTKALYGSTQSPWLVEPIQEIFPNPATGVVYIPVSGMQQQLSVRVVSVQGQEMMRWSNQAAVGRAVLPIDVSYLPQGCYFVEIADGVQSQHRKLVIRR